MITDLCKLTPQQNAELLNAVFVRFQQPFSIVSVSDGNGNKEVTIRLRSGIRKRITVFQNGHVQIQKNS